MRCNTTELEIETIYNRIVKGDIELQPEFQRGEVWTPQKKKKLIDSILRGWKIPPIHVIEGDNYMDEVLDGQQRLVTIRDFIDGSLQINGMLPPEDENIMKLNNCYFQDLDIEVRRRFMKYSLTVVRLTEYLPEEPAELFYRLNQPATLTSAEQRNAFIGKTRSQIKSLVEIFEANGADKETVGFSNSRMAYDEVISKLCYALSINTLRKKITSTMVSDMYRSNNFFDSTVIEEAKQTLVYFIDSIQEIKKEYAFKSTLNKATLFSWLIFAHRNKGILNKYQIGSVIYEFEYIRQSIKGKNILSQNYEETQQRGEKILEGYPYFQSMILLFNQKASMGSTDATAIIHRDIILEISKEILLDDIYPKEYLGQMEIFLSKGQNILKGIENLAEKYNWGEDLSYERC